MKARKMKPTTVHFPEHMLALMDRVVERGLHENRCGLIRYAVKVYLTEVLGVAARHGKAPRGPHRAPR